MRDIGKYRGQRKDNGERVYGGIYTLEDSVFIVTCYGDRHYIKDSSYYCSFNGYEVLPETVGEFTGEHDKERSRFFPHGKEIWEGDKVKASIYQGEDPQILPVYYDKGAFWIDYKDSESDRVPVGCFIGSLEVIGNDEESCVNKT